MNLEERPREMGISHRNIENNHFEQAQRDHNVPWAEGQCQENIPEEGWALEQSVDI